MSTCLRIPPAKCPDPSCIATGICFEDRRVMRKEILPICDFCEQGDPTCSFDSDWDAVICLDCSDLMDAELKRIASDRS
jgi:hypothetical protein